MPSVETRSAAANPRSKEKPGGSGSCSERSENSGRERVEHRRKRPGNNPRITHVAREQRHDRQHRKPVASCAWAASSLRGWARNVIPKALTKHAAASAPVKASMAPVMGNMSRTRLGVAAETRQQRLVGEPFTDESVQRGQGGDGHRAHQEANAVCGIRLISPPNSSMLRVWVA